MFLKGQDTAWQYRVTTVTVETGTEFPIALRSLLPRE